MNLPNAVKVVVSKWVADENLGYVNKWTAEACNGVIEGYAMTTEGVDRRFAVVDGRVFCGKRVSSVKFPDDSLDHDIIKQACNEVFNATMMSVARQFNYSGPRNLPEGNKLTDILQPFIDQVAACWGVPIAEMFDIMTIEEESRADALYYVLMNCKGHGIGLNDRFSKNVDYAEEKIGPIDICPFQDEMNELDDLAENTVQAALIDPDNITECFDTAKTLEANIALWTGEKATGHCHIVGYLEGRAVVKMLDGDNAGVLYVSTDENELIDPTSE